MSIKLKPLLMRFRVDIQDKSSTKDGDGNQVIEWVDFKTSMPASIYHLSGKELMSADQLESQHNARIVMYKMDGLKTRMRITHNDVYYYINDIVVDPTNNLYQTMLVTTGFKNG